MQQLSGLDTGFLSMETANTTGHVSMVGILDPSSCQPALTLDALAEVVASRLHLLPPLRQRLVEVPFGIDRPYWVDDPEFDLDFHLRELALPPPGDDRQLAEQAARIASRPLDRSRPLWELYLIWGVEGDQAALMTKVHHAAVDGMAYQELMTTLLDPTPEPRQVPPAPPWRPGRVPTEPEMWLRGVAGLGLQPLRLLQLQWRALQSLPGGARAATRAAGRPPAGGWLPGRGNGSTGRDGDGGALGGGGALLRPAPKTSFNRMITPHRRVAFGKLPLADAKAVKNAFSVTLNDVVMAMCAAALRRWLQDHKELPADPLIAAVPISVRTKEQQGSFGNRVSSMLAPIPTHLADPVERLRAVHEAMKVAKTQHAAVPAELLQDAAKFAMPALTAGAARAAAQMRIADVVNPPFNLVISNVPGPREPLYVAGARLLSSFPVSAIGDGLGLNMTVQSYLDDLDFGLVACRELVPDLWNLLDYLGDALEELKAVAPAGGRAPDAGTAEPAVAVTGEESEAGNPAGSL
jgi:diacylglycerol O-acyltransferase